MQRVAAGFLLDVGQLPEQGLFYPLAYHLRRCLSDNEMATLDPAWCALPALDDGGTPEEARAMLIEMGVLT